MRSDFGTPLPVDVRPRAGARTDDTSLPSMHPRPGNASSSDAWAASSLGTDGPLLGQLLKPADLASAPQLPAVGTSFLGFHLVAELGRGAFGCVYLARQGELAGRLVALKVSTEIIVESQRLARLQHTHIVPIYSVHRSGPLQAVCMPYFGATTLADVLQTLDSRKALPGSGKGLTATLRNCRSDTVRSKGEGPSKQLPAAPAAAPVQSPTLSAGAKWRTLEMLEGFSYVDAILWITGRLADGLSHAHERGILHRDLKPANVLLTDEGQPMLLDFNLAEDTNQAPGGHFGGTLPYMAPEHMTAFSGSHQIVDARSDIYSLGIMLFELLTGRAPFSRFDGPIATVVPQMIAERSQPAPAPRSFEPKLPRAVDAIVRKCLDPDPARRYQSAADLREDLDRQLSHRPLRFAADRSLSERVGKWVRRDPRLAVAGPLMLVGAVVLAGLGTLALSWSRHAANQQVRAENAETHNDARANFLAFRSEMAVARLLLSARGEYRGEIERGMDVAKRALARFPSADPASAALQPLSPQERSEARIARGELLLLLAGTTMPGQDAADALALNQQAEACFDGQPPQALFAQRAELALQAGRPADARIAEAQAQATPLRHALDFNLMARLKASQGRYSEAAALLQQGLMLDDRQPAAWTLLGHLCLDRLAGREGDASSYYSSALGIVPNDAALLGHRGLANHRRRDFARAEADFQRALELEPTWLVLHQHHARVREEMALEADRLHQPFAATLLRLSALAELIETAKAGWSTNRSLLARARLRNRLGDRAGAARERAAALALAPADAENSLARGLARLERGDARGALADFEATLRADPHSVAGLQNQSHVLAEYLHRDREAMAALDRVLELQPGIALNWSSKAVLAARLGQDDLARESARKAFELDTIAAVQYQNAGVYALLARHTERRCAVLVARGVLGGAPADWRTDAARLIGAAALDRDQALRLIGRAFRKGYGYDVVEIDPDLAPLHADNRFQALVQMARSVRMLPAAD